ncbi:MAG: hypothetical protein ACFFCH_05085 [Promethearchaeota archaeon]
MTLDPDDLDPLRRGEPRPIHPKDPRQPFNADILALLRQLVVRVEQLEKDMHEVKEKLKI